jgi:hypothetical protein
MIITKLMGGLGNQMFQYALCRRLSLENGVPLGVDLSFLQRRDMGPGFTYRDYDLDMFSMEPNLSVPVGEKIFLINQPHFHYSADVVSVASRLLQAGKHVMLDGYWQTPKYFGDFEANIKQDFQFRNKIDDATEQHVIDLLGLIRSTNSVMINIRRTDYLSNNFHGVMGSDYFEHGAKLIAKRVENPKYFVFSDDYEWCLANLKIKDAVFVDSSYSGKKYEYKFQLMKECKHFVISNSTFAWWPAWLSCSSPDKQVIAPSRWFADSNINTNDLIPSDWIRI